MKLLPALILLLAALVAPSPAAAEGGGITCPAAPNVLASVCVNCFFPMRIAGAPVGGVATNLPDVFAPSVCVCPGRFFGYPTPGISYGMWMPTHLMDLTRKVGCSPTLGTSLLSDAASGTLAIKQGGAHDQGASSSSMYHWNLWVSPVGQMMEQFQDSLCPSKAFGAEFDLAWVSFIDPTWDNETLALFQTPEAALFANPIAAAACAVDAISSTVYKPLDFMPWCVGAWGTAYPFSGIRGGHRSVLVDTGLAAVKGVAMTHRRGMSHLEYGPTAVCASHPFPTLPKQQYRYQVAYPVPQIEFNHWGGTETMKGIEFRHIPVKGEDWVQYLWTYRECCINF